MKHVFTTDAMPVTAISLTATRLSMAAVIANQVLLVALIFRLASSAPAPQLYGMAGYPGLAGDQAETASGLT